MFARACSIVGIEFAVLIGVLSLPASVKFRLVFWNISGICRIFVESLRRLYKSLCGIWRFFAVSV